MQSYSDIPSTHHLALGMISPQPAGFHLPQLLTDLQTNRVRLSQSVNISALSLPCVLRSGITLGMKNALGMFLKMCSGKFLKIQKWTGYCNEISGFCLPVFGDY